MPTSTKAKRAAPGKGPSSKRQSRNAKNTPWNLHRANGLQVLQAPNLSGDIASGVAGGISGGASGIGATILQALGVSRLTDLLWRVGLLVVALVLIIVVASALTAKATQNVVEGVANSKPAQTVRQVAPFVK